MDSAHPHSQLLVLQNLSIGISGRPLLSGIDYILNSGEIIAVTGPSGLGKTTLLRCIGGLTNPLSGHILLNGRTPEEWSYPKYRRRVVWVSQHPIMMDLSVRGNLLKPFEYHSKTIQYNEESAGQLLDAMGVGSARLEQNARTLSVGQQQRVALTRALLLQPDILLLDEPTSALDVESVGLVEKTLKQTAHGQGLGILAVTHDPRQAERFCDRVFDLKTVTP